MSAIAPSGAAPGLGKASTGSGHHASGQRAALRGACSSRSPCSTALIAPARPAARRRYFTFGAATAMLAIGLNARPDSSLQSWADKKAAERRAASA